MLLQSAGKLLNCCRLRGAKFVRFKANFRFGLKEVFLDNTTSHTDRTRESFPVFSLNCTAITDFHKPHFGTWGHSACSLLCPLGRPLHRAPSVTSPPLQQNACHFENSIWGAPVMEISPCLLGSPLVWTLLVRRVPVVGLPGGDNVRVMCREAVKLLSDFISCVCWSSLTIPPPIPTALESLSRYFHSTAPQSPTFTSPISVLGGILPAASFVHLGVHYTAPHPLRRPLLQNACHFENPIWGAPVMEISPLLVGKPARLDSSSSRSRPSWW
ncbi:hypothetical protein CEXT_453591 [Caerostris extrusa]|uniref:Uncharacterized protein n=1 Tax=Caerostris extrusa TaxID=172846 RepID=A0AAV4NEP6_CAEEX|nr:hypothetical protein CEXT_453591 [Caerostris extrusa]